MKYLALVGLAAALVFTGGGCADQTAVEDNVVQETEHTTLNSQEEPMAEWTYQGVLPEEEISGKQIRITTEKGDIVFELFADTAPIAVSNMVALTNGEYYNNLTFHRRVEGFVIQGGDPNGNGTGGPGYAFEDELSDEYAYEKGIVAMANSGPNTNGSQFFIMLEDYPLPKAYTIFGRVLEGQDVVDQIAVGDVMTTVVVEDKTTE